MNLFSVNESKLTRAQMKAFYDKKDLDLNTPLTISVM